MIESKPIGGKIFTKPFKVLMVFAIIAVIFMIKRVAFGLGSVTNLNDGYPWGLWIAVDVAVGVVGACDQG